VAIADLPIAVLNPPAGAGLEEIGRI
jgi:hypothetical protein